MRFSNSRIVGSEDMESFLDGKQSGMYSERGALKVKQMAVSEAEQTRSLTAVSQELLSTTRRRLYWPGDSSLEYPCVISHPADLPGEGF